ncbi:Phosphodiesterase [Gracilaria domingensis]|nr:Phosphodiesterase [Gracilaria domingensis]
MVLRFEWIVSFALEIAVSRRSRTGGSAQDERCSEVNKCRFHIEKAWRAGGCRWGMKAAAMKAVHVHTMREAGKITTAEQADSNGETQAQACHETGPAERRREEGQQGGGNKQLCGAEVETKAAAAAAMGDGRGRGQLA